MQEKAEIYWNNLSICDKTKFLQKHSFWNGYRLFMYKYLPDELKKEMMAEIGYN